MQNILRHFIIILHLLQNIISKQQEVQTQHIPYFYKIQLMDLQHNNLLIISQFALK